MRSLLLLSILLAATTTACNQSLTPMTGTGGTGAATGGGAGGTGPGAGGSGGSAISAACNALVAEYQSALTAAETCEVGASGQCQQSVVTGSLSGCSCPTYVTDSSALSTIEKAWQAAGCVAPGSTCLCPIALNNTCVSTDGGSVGFCSYVPGTGGTSGTGGGGAGGTTGSGGSSEDGGLINCGTLASEYAAVLIGARSCTAGAASQCGQRVPTALSACSSGCTELVTDSSVLNTIQMEWTAAGCGDVPVLCPLIACASPVSAACVPSDAGGSVCAPSYQPISTN